MVCSSCECSHSLAVCEKDMSEALLVSLLNQHRVLSPHTQQLTQGEVKVLSHTHTQTHTHTQRASARIRSALLLTLSM